MFQMRKMPLAIWALVIASFAMGADEFIVAGVVEDIAAALGVTIGAVGLFESAYAIGVAIGAPLFAAFSGKASRRTTLLTAAGIFLLGNLISLLGPDYGWIMVGRIVAALAHGAFFGIAAVFAAELVAAKLKGRAIATVFAGSTAATILGAPIGAAVGRALGWRATFGTLVLFGAIALMGLVFLLPRGIGRTKVREVAPEHSHGRLEPARLHEGCGRGARLAVEDPAERSHAHRAPVGERGHRQVGVGMLGDERQEVAEWFPQGPAHRELCADLGELARPMDEDDHLAGRCHGECRTVVVLDEGEREVDAGGHASRRPHVAVAHVDAVGLDADRGEVRREGVAHRPVGRRPAPVEQARPREQQSAAAHRRDPPRRPGRAGQPANEVEVISRLTRAVTAGHHQRVDRTSDRPSWLGSDDQSRRGREHPARHRHDRRRVRGARAESIGHREHFEGTYDVQAQHPGERDDGHDPGIGRRRGTHSGHARRRSSAQQGRNFDTSGHDGRHQPCVRWNPEGSARRGSVRAGVARQDATIENVLGEVWVPAAPSPRDGQRDRRRAEHWQEKIVSRSVVHLPHGRSGLPPRLSPRPLPRRGA
jgi:hypothetical protein